MKLNAKLCQYLEHSIYKSNGVITALCAISDTLSNQDKLIKRYGLSLKLAKGHDIREIDDDTQLVADGSTPSTIQNAAAEV